MEFLTPKPLPNPLIRIGGVSDGGYLLPDDLEGIKHCFSPGVDNRKTFEDDLTRNYGINTHLADFSSSVERFRTPLIPRRQTFIKKWLGQKSGGDVISLADWVSQTGSGRTEELMLQMDVEGAEYEIFRSVPRKLLARFRIIVLELHRLEQLSHGPSTAKNLGRLAEQLDPLFASVHLHPNNCCGVFYLNELSLDIPRVVELTLLRKDRFDERFATPGQRVHMPHPLDILFNQVEKPPLHLSEKWIEEGRSVGSKTRIVLAWIIYATLGLWIRQLRRPAGSRKDEVRA